MTYTAGSEEPSATTRAGAASIREMFVALVNEGFTESQALSLCGQMLAASAAAHVTKGDD